MAFIAVSHYIIIIIIISESVIAADDGGFIAYDLRGLVKISKIGYENSSGSMIFAAEHYNSVGGNITLKIPQMVDSQKVNVLMDGKPYEKAKINMDGKTVRIDIFIPPAEHSYKSLYMIYMNILNYISRLAKMI